LFEHVKGTKQSHAANIYLICNFILLDTKAK